MKSRSELIADRCWGTAYAAGALGVAVTAGIGVLWAVPLYALMVVLALFALNADRFVRWHKRDRQRRHIAEVLENRASVLEREMEQHGPAAPQRFRTHYAGEIANYHADLLRCGVEDNRIQRAGEVSDENELASVLHALRQSARRLRRWWDRWPLLW